MKITESQNPDIVFICLSPFEAKMLAKQLLTNVGVTKKPMATIQKLTNQMVDLFYLEDLENDEP